MSRILIADDNAQNLYLLETLLSSYGHEVISTHDGAEALSSAIANPPDIIVSDILMPVMDGFELCRHWKTTEQLRQIPFIVYTSTYVDRKDEQLAHNLGADRFIIKPQQPEVLIKIIQEVLANVAQSAHGLKADEKDVLVQYNEVLFHKLTEKIEQLESEIEKQKQTATALNESEKRYHNLVEQSPDGIFIVNLNGIFLSVNRIMCEILKYGEAELLTMCIWDIVPERYIEQHKRRIADILTGKIPNGAAEYSVSGKDGEMHSVEILSAPYYEGEQLIGFQGIARDITDRRQAEAKLLISEEKYRTVVENASEALIVVQDHKIKFANPRAYTLIGYPKIQADDAVFVHFIHPEDRATVIDRNIRRLKGEHFEDEYPIRIIDYQGTTRWAQISTALINWEGRPATLTFITDVTGRKLAEDELLKSYEKIRKGLTDAINTMAKIVELRDPYTSGHQLRVAQLAASLAGEMKLDQTVIENIRMAAMTHDIGKIYIPSDILNKPGKLSTIELNLIRTHARSSHDIVTGMDFPPAIAQAVLQHHERLDGSGYPDGLKSENISIEAKILAVADVVEAMSSHRPYRPAQGIDKALEEISTHRGILYDTETVDACVKLYREKGFAFSG